MMIIFLLITTSTETDNQDLNIAIFLLKNTKGVVFEKCMRC